MKSNFSLIAADTSRTRIYLHELIKNNLLPKNIILLKSKEEESSKTLPGQVANKSFKGKSLKDEYNQEQICLFKNLESWINEINVPYLFSESKDINAISTIDAIKKLPDEVIVYSGYGGGILKNDVLSTGKKFLHIHGGYLPKYKGSTTNYYSILSSNTIGATAIFLDKNIDSGPILLRRNFPRPNDCREIDHIIDSKIRASVLIEVLKEFTVKGYFTFKKDINLGGDMYYIIHPVLKHIAILSNP